MQLAINGGSRVRQKPFPQHKTIGQAEIDAVAQVMQTGALSRFLGAEHSDFYGGPQVRALESEWATWSNAAHAVSVNSNTSGLYCAMGAIGIQPGDEVIVCAYSMSISATAPMLYGGIPVFADIEPDFLCLAPESIESCISSRTRAILVVDLFGQVFDMDAIRAIAEKHDLYIVEDCAQAPGAHYKNTNAGTLGHIGVFSLNYHKHIHTGEGGIVVTDDTELAERLMLIRNHAESVVSQRQPMDNTNMLGFNFRMTEIEAAIAREQLKKLPDLLTKRRANVSYLEQELSFVTSMQALPCRPECQHAYYVHGFLWDRTQTGIHRNTFVEAVKAELPHYAGRESEGVKLGFGYVKPLYRLPIFTHSNYPSNFTQNRRDYGSVTCPVVENLHTDTLVHHEFMLPSMNEDDLADVVSAFEKVWDMQDQLVQKAAA